MTCNIFWTSPTDTLINHQKIKIFIQIGHLAELLALVPGLLLGLAAFLDKLLLVDLGGTDTTEAHTICDLRW